MLPPPPLGSLDMSQPPAPLQIDRRLSLHSSESSDLSRSNECRSYEAEERKLGDSSSDSGASSHSNASFSSSMSRQSFKRAERMVIPVKDGEGEGLSLAEAFQRRHPRFRDRIESHRDKLKRQREKQQQQREAAQNAAVKGEDSGLQSPRGRSATSSEPPLTPAKQNLLDRLASGSRAKISKREMTERSRRLYHQLPEVVERKRQEEMLRRRRQRLDELREQEKQRRLQQKQRRQRLQQYR